jgi:hypothetical protein
MNDRPVSVQIAMKSAEPVDGWLFDSSAELPASLESLVEARLPFASPVHDGDSALLARSIRL